MLRLNSIDELCARAGTTLGHSGWHEVTLEGVAAFAAATGDYEAVHLDPAAARRQGYDDVIAHGLYTLSLGPHLMGQVYDMPNFSNAVNYGYDRVRFMSPVVVGTSVRLQLDLVSAQPFDTGARLLFRQTIEQSGKSKPACVAEFVSQYYR